MLKDNLGEAFDDTLVVTLTEFGRKVDENGGYGTEHVHGTAILIAGSLVKNLRFMRTGLVCQKRLCLRDRISILQLMLERSIAQRCLHVSMLTLITCERSILE